MPVRAVRTGARAAVMVVGVQALWVRRRLLMDYWRIHPTWARVVVVIIMRDGVVVTVAAFLLWFAGVERVEGSLAGVFTGLLPVSALVLSYVWLGEVFLFNHVIGCALVLGAIALVVMPGRTAAGKPAPSTRPAK